MFLGENIFFHAQVYTNPTTEAATTTTTTTTTTRPSLSQDAKQRLKHKVMLCFFQGICRWIFKSIFGPFWMGGLPLCSCSKKVSINCNLSPSRRSTLSSPAMTTRGSRKEAGRQQRWLQQQQLQQQASPRLPEGQTLRF